MVFSKPIASLGQGPAALTAEVEQWIEQRVARLGAPGLTSLRPPERRDLASSARRIALSRRGGRLPVDPRAPPHEINMAVDLDSLTVRATR
ncbi:MAG: hypothetical protein IPG84_12295 [Betaproteobacteria bacterium]|nr:hypothetical protein [Betaproteobacteria bacterium]